MSASSIGSQHHRNARDLRLVEFDGRVTVELWNGEGVKVEATQPQFAGSVLSEVKGDTVVVKKAGGSHASSISFGGGGKGSSFVLNIGPGTVIGATAIGHGAVARGNVTVGHDIAASDENSELRVFVPKGAQIRILNIGGTVTVKGDIDGKLEVENLRNIRVSALGRLREVFVRPLAPLALILEGGVTDSIVVEAENDDVGVIVANAETAAIDVALGRTNTFSFDGTVTQRFKLSAKGESTIAVGRFTGNPADCTYTKEPRATIKVNGIGV